MIDIGVNAVNGKLKHKIPKMIEDAKTVGVNKIILTGTSLRVSKEAVSLTKKYPDTFVTTAGVHPHNAKEWNPQLQKEIESLLKEKSVVAVGECGLDYDRNFSTKEEQLHAFEAQIKLAIQYKKPLFLHEREAFDDFVAMLKKYPEVLPYSVVHCFTSNTERLQAYLDLGVMIGITGWVCDNRRGKDLQEAVKILPIDRLMIETDAPFLKPHNVPNNERINEPKYLPYVVKQLSTLMDVSELELKEKTVKNTKRFFKLL